MELVLRLSEEVKAFRRLETSNSRVGLYGTRDFDVA